MLSSARTTAVYRSLLRRVVEVEGQCRFSSAGGLFTYAKSRFREEAEMNYRNVALALDAENTQERAELFARDTAIGDDDTRHMSKQERLEMCQMDIEQQLYKTEAFTSALSHCAENNVMRRMADALALGLGSTAYKQTIEDNFMSSLNFHAERVQRKESDENATAERQNRVMQLALAQYAEQLEVLNRKDLNEEQIVSALRSPKEGSTLDLLPHGPQLIAVTIDQELNKQTILVAAQDYNFEDEPRHRVETMEAEVLRSTIFHADWLRTAQRIQDSLLDETQIHRSRGTVVAGHGVGGAIALCLAMLLQADGFEIRNAISFGAPKVIESSLERHVFHVNPLRFVIEGDPLVGQPATGSEGHPFKHVGEVIEVNDTPSAQGIVRDDDDEEDDGSDDFVAESIVRGKPRAATYSSSSMDDEQGEQQSAEETEATDEDAANKFAHCPRGVRPFSITHYLRCVSDPAIPLEYYETSDDEDWHGEELLHQQQQSGGENVASAGHGFHDEKGAAQRR